MFNTLGVRMWYLYARAHKATQAPKQSRMINSIYTDNRTFWNLKDIILG